MKLGNLLNLHKYKIQDNLDDNLMQFILNLDLIVEKEEIKKIEANLKKIKPKKTVLEIFSKYKSGDAERDFIIDILENNPKYSSYKYTYLSWVNLNLYDYIEEGIEDISDLTDINIYKIVTDDEVSECDVIDGIRDIDKIIEIFKEKLLPPIDIDAVYEEFSDIFEKVVGERRGFLKDLDGKWHKFGNDPDSDCELLCIKYPSFGEVMENESIRNHFIEYLKYGADDCLLYDYNEKEIINGWY